VACLIARNKNDREVLVELDVHRAHLALGIVDLVDALFFLLDPLGSLQPRSARAAVTLAMSASGTLSSSSSARAAVQPKASRRAMAKAFITGKSSSVGLLMRRNYPAIVSDI
jgi:hypothetical protein